MRFIKYLIPPGLIILIGFIGSILFSKTIGAMGWIPLTLVYWSTIFIVVYRDAKKTGKPILNYFKVKKFKWYLIFIALFIGFLPFPIFLWSYTALNTAFLIISWILVALIFAELAGIIPVSGYSYQWMKRLSTPFVSWITGWISFCFLILVIPAVDWGLAPVLAGLLNIPITDQNIMIIVMCTIIVQVTLNIIGVKLAALINNGAVFTEAIGMIGLTIFLFVAAFNSDADFSILLNIPCLVVSI